MKTKVVAVFVIICLVMIIDYACIDKLNDANQHNNAGMELFNQGLFNESIDEFSEAIRLDPQLALAYYNRGTAYNALGEYERAIEDLEEAISLDPQLEQAYHNRGATYKKLGE